jgi:hypothetical protein
MHGVAYSIETLMATKFTNSSPSFRYKGAPIADSAPRASNLYPGEPHNDQFGCPQDLSGVTVAPEPNDRECARLFDRQGVGSAMLSEPRAPAEERPDCMTIHDIASGQCPVLPR